MSERTGTRWKALAAGCLLGVMSSFSALAENGAEPTPSLADILAPTAGLDGAPQGSNAQDELFAERKVEDFDARGVVMPNAEVTLSASVSGRIKTMPFRNGHAFRKGDTLVEFDCSRQEADLRGAKAVLSKARSYHKGKQRLKQRGAAGAQEVREAGADVETAKASVDGLSEIIRLCQITAPFDGRVVERHAETYEIPAVNAPVLSVVDSSRLELDLIVPSTWLRWVAEGTHFTFSVDELGKSFDARVLRLGAKVDPVSQTIKITGAFADAPQRVLAGMSGTARFVPPTN
ncbi:MAG: efflux RND transporter periplasmic adaptor subunit [Ahrensia sp.]|nr:efflux RND transporter periplasmic adaptor subunit [Ahrensia sp.]